MKAGALGFVASSRPASARRFADMVYRRHPSHASSSADRSAAQGGPGIHSGTDATGGAAEHPRTSPRLRPPHPRHGMPAPPLPRVILGRPQRSAGRTGDPFRNRHERRRGGAPAQFAPPPPAASPTWYAGATPPTRHPRPTGAQRREDRDPFRNRRERRRGGAPTPVPGRRGGGSGPEWIPDTTLFTALDRRSGMTKVGGAAPRKIQWPGGTALPLLWVGQLSRAEVEQICRRLPEVQSMADAAARQYPASESSSSAARGTAIHLTVKRQIDALNDQRLRAEISLWNSNQVPEPNTDRPRYGARGSLRVDILELRSDDVRSGSGNLNKGYEWNFRLNAA
jgi:hypothetical protein